MTNFSKSIDRNPLIEGLPCDITETEWWGRLTFDPFAGNDLQEMSPFRKQLFVDRFKDLFVPTYQLAAIANQIHRMLIGGLIDRDPYSPEQRRRLHQLCRRRSKSEPPCRPNIEPGVEAGLELTGCG